MLRKEKICHKTIIFLSSAILILELPEDMLKNMKSKDVTQCMIGKSQKVHGSEVAKEDYNL
jgi:hypothetical protein